jgi:hypothetical protein
MYFLYVNSEILHCPLNTKNVQYKHELALENNHKMTLVIFFLKHKMLQKLIAYSTKSLETPEG